LLVSDVNLMNKLFLKSYQRAASSLVPFVSAPFSIIPISVLSLSVCFSAPLYAEARSVPPNKEQAPNAKSAKSAKSTKSTNRIETITVLGSSNVSEADLAGIELNALPINTHVVGRIEIERLKFVDPDELLDRIPGETQVRNLRIPDGGKGYTIPLLDGVPLENPYEGATQRMDRVNTNDIERVEVIKGPASALYGNNAFGGVINVVSRRPPQEWQGSAAMEWGSFNRSRTDFTLAGSEDDVGVFFNINHRHLDGEREGVKDDRKQASTKLVYDVSDSTELSIRGEYLEEEFVERGDLTAEQLAADPKQVGGLNSSTDLEQTTLAVQLRHVFSAGLLEDGQLQANLVRREKDTIGLSRFRGPQDENDVGYSVRLLYSQALQSDNLAFGYERYDGEQDTQQFARDDVNLTGEFTAFENDLTINAYFGQYVLNPVEPLSISLGVRHERIELASTFYDQQANFSDTSPKLGLTWQFTAQHRAWLGVTKGFYAPDVGSLFDVDDGNPDLKPEEAENREIGFRGAFKNVFEGLALAGEVSYDISFYDMDITNYLVTQEFVNPDGSEFERTTNAGAVSIRGVESVIEYQPANANWRLGLTHTYTNNTYDSFVQSTPGASDDLSGKILRRSPKHHVNVRAAWLPTDALSVELEVDMYSEYFADNANSAESAFTRDERVNLRLDYQLDDWRLWLHGLNLTDTLEDRATFSRGVMRFRTANGRTFYAGASYHF